MTVCNIDKLQCHADYSIIVGYLYVVWNAQSLSITLRANMLFKFLNSKCQILFSTSRFIPSCQNYRHFLLKQLFLHLFRNKEQISKSQDNSNCSLGIKQNPNFTKYLMKPNLPFSPWEKSNVNLVIYSRTCSTNKIFNLMAFIAAMEKLVLGLLISQ